MTVALVYAAEWLGGKPLWSVREQLVMTGLAVLIMVLLMVAVGLGDSHVVPYLAVASLFVYCLWAIDRVVTREPSFWLLAYYTAWSLGSLIPAILVFVWWKLTHGEVGLVGAPTTYVGVVWGLALDVFVLTVAFAVGTVILLKAGAVGLAGRTPRDEWTWSAMGYFGWHFLDEIPSLKIPQSLNWNLRPFIVGWGAGSVLLLYKITVIFPAVRAYRRAMTIRQASRAAAADGDAASPEPDDTVRARRPPRARSHGRSGVTSAG